MKTKLFLLLFVICSFANAQNSTFYNGFDSVELATGWTSNGLTRTTTQPCTGTASMTATTGQFAAVEIVSPNYLSDGQAITLSCNYKMNAPGIVYIQYSTDSVNWVNVAVTSATATTCSILSGVIAADVVPAGSNVRFKILTYNPTILNVTYFFDDFQAVQTNGVLSEYDFNNDLLNKTGANPFSTNDQLTYVNGRDGSTNGAVNLNGGGTTATIPGLPYGNSSRTVSMWVKMNAVANNFNFLYHYGTSNNGQGALIKPLEAVQFATNPSHSVATNNVINTWYHYVFIYDGSNSKIYKDGVLLGTAARSWSLTNNANIFKLGLSETGALNFYNGAIDDLKIYNIALSDTQVLNLFTNNSAFVATAPLVSNINSSNITPVAATINYAINANNEMTDTTIKYGLSSTNLTNQVAGLIANGNNLVPTSSIIPNLESNTQYFYQIEATNSVGTTLSDVLSFTTLALPPAIAEYDFNNTYTNLDGTNPFTSGTGTSFVQGRDGLTSSGALNISNFVPSATIANLPYGASPRTISFWAKTNFMFNGSNAMFSYGNSGINNGNTGSFDASQVTYSANSNNVVVAATTQQNVWYYFTYVYDGVNAKIYRNGVLLASEPKSWNTINNNDIFRLGTGSNNVGAFNGAFDDLKIYDYALSDNQITNLYNYNTITTPVAILPIVSNVVATPSTTAANVSYTINANYSPTTTIIKYGTSSTDLSTQITGFSTNGNSTTNSITIEGLTVNTEYFYQIEATNAIGTTISTQGNFTTNEASLALAEYTFDNTLSDVNGANAFASQSGMIYGTNRAGVENKALFINGTGTTVSLTTLPVGNSSRTFSIWIKPTQFNGANRIFSYGSPSGTSAYGASFLSNIVYNFNWINNVSSVENTDLNVWKHIVCTYEQSTGTIKLYTDGVFRTLANLSWSTANNGVLYLGSLFGEAGGKYIGYLDDLQIYDFALTDAQVTSLFTNNFLSTENINRNNLQVTLYPNPTKNSFTITTEAEIAAVEIYSSQGQKVCTSTQKNIDISQLASGVYFVKIETTEKIQTIQKLVKQ